METIEYVGRPDLEPSRAHETDAGFDLRACLGPTGVVLRPGNTVTVPCGFSATVPARHVGFVCPRSGLADKYGITVLNSPGVIDAGFRGDWQVILTHQGTVPLHIRDGDRIAQLVVLELPEVTFVQVEELGSSERGDNGLGSTGVGDES